MTNFLKGALVGAIALGGLTMTAAESSAMPLGDVGPAISTDSGVHASIDKVWWRYGWGWRRPYYRGGWGYGWGWRRPYYGYGWGWRRPYYRRYWW